MTILSVFNGKGGTTKSTLSTAIFDSLVRRGYQPLLIDLDEQSDSSYMLGVDEDLSKPDIFDVLTGEAALDEAIQEASGGLVVPGSKNMAMVDMVLADMADPIGRLDEALKGSKKIQDFVILDLSPHDGLAVKNALLSSDAVLIPLTPDMLSIKSMQAIEESIKKVQQTVNPNLRVGGLVLTRYDGRPLFARAAKKKVEELAQEMGTDFLGIIRETIKVREAQAARTSIFTYAPRNPVVTDIERIVDAFLGKEKDA